MRRIFPDDELQGEFIERGYVKKTLLSGREVGAILDQLHSLRPADAFSPDGRGVNRSTYHCTFLDTDTEYKRRAAALIAEVFTPLIDETLSDYRILTGNFYVKPPGRGRFEIHQNWQSTADIEDTTLTIWCPLVDVDESNGTIQVVEGSHKIVPHVAAISARPYFESFEDVLLEKYLRPVPLAAGECLIFDDSLIHYSERNGSELPRYAIQVETLPVESAPVLHYFDPEKPELGFELFAVDSDFFITNTVTAFQQRPAGLRTLGFVANHNRPLTEREFEERLRLGERTRAAIYGSRG